MMQFRTAIPIVIKKTNECGYAIYVESGGIYENDIWTCVLSNGGIVRHYTTDQLLIHTNATFDICKLDERKE
jgi:hypothetical protein